MEGIRRARAAVTDIALCALDATEARTNALGHGVRTGPAELMNRVLETFLRAIGGDAAGLWEHVRDGWSSPLFVTPPDVWKRLPHGRTRTSDAARIHPGVQHCLEAMPTAPFTVTDVLSERDWQKSDIARTMRPNWGRNFQLMVPIDTDSADPTWWVWVIGRERADFTSADRLTASAAQPLLTAITRHFAAIERARRPEVARTLTGRERTVLALLLDGHPTAEISARIAISPRTVHKHVERIYRKYDVHDRSALMVAVDALSENRDC